MRFRTARFAPLRTTNYRWYLAATLLVTVSLEIQGAALFWQVYQLTKNNLLVGMIGLAEALPVILFALIAGHVSDRLDRRKLVLLASSALLICSLLLWWCSLQPQHPGLQWYLYAITAWSGVGRSFFTPARAALGAELVSREHYADAISLRSATWQLGVVAGPGIGGLLIALAHGGLFLAYGTDALLMVLALGCWLTIRHHSAPRSADPGPWRHGLRQGVRFVWRESTLLSAMSLDLFAVLFGGATAMLPAYAKSVLMVGPLGYGWLRSGQSVGAIVMWLAMSMMRPWRNSGAVMLWSVVGFGVCWMLISYCHWFLATLLLLMLAGALDYISVVVRSTLIQMRTPRHLLGRVTAVSSIFVGSSNEIGGFESGVMADAMGLQPSVAVGGALTIVVVGITALVCPALRRLGSLDAITQAPTAEEALGAIPSGPASTPASAASASTPSTR
jgi:MFS family permease